jgi:hypothetical protein
LGVPKTRGVGYSYERWIYQLLTQHIRHQCAIENRYTCPAGKTLRYQEREKKGTTMRYRRRAAQADCSGCPQLA